MLMGGHLFRNNYLFNLRKSMDLLTKISSAAIVGHNY